MKKLLAYCCIAAIATLFTLSCTDPTAPTCRISKFYWEDQWHVAHYYSSGRLKALIADSSKVLFYYDDLLRLTSAEIYMGDVDPFYKFQFIHGPDGIIQSDEYHPSPFGVQHNRYLFHYSGPTTVDYVIKQEFGNDETIGFQIQYDITYGSGNVKYIEGSSTVIHTDYFGYDYDTNGNPFRVLAAAVGNDEFFPVCKMANFPVSDYDISFMNIFSRNNPLRAQYEITGSGLEPQKQTFKYSYYGGIASKLLWTDSSYGNVDSEDYAFVFECRHLRTDE